jgi:acyl-CoA thioester hydrolase
MSSGSCLAPASGRLQDGEHCFPVRVYFEDTDLTGVVYHANYLRYMERARSDMLRLLGIDQRGAKDSGEGHYAVTELAIRYRAPARLDDDLVVRSRVMELTIARCVIAQSVWREETELSQGSVTVAFLDPRGRPRRQPPAWIELFSPHLAKDSATA